MNELSVPYACATPRKMYDCEIHSFSQIHISKIKVTIGGCSTLTISVISEKNVQKCTSSSPLLFIHGKINEVQSNQCNQG